MSDGLQNKIIFQQVAELLQNARQQVLRTVNSTMTITYFEIGRIIVEEEQNGKDRAEYGKQLLKGLSQQLTEEFGKGFSVESLDRMRKFYQIYSISSSPMTKLQNRISQSLTGELKTKKSQSVAEEFQSQKAQSLASFFKLTWTHYIFLMRIEDEQERRFYEIESEKYNWSVRELKRQYDTALYTRLALSRDKEGILELSEQGQIIEKPKDIIKDPYILEFLGLPELNQYSESQLEEEIINKLEHFLLELGHGFTFVARQNRITFDDKHFRIDLVFYNRILRCFVLIDLKIGELKHQDLGQMQMYVNYYDREMRLEDENKTIGIVLCQNKSEAVVKYTLPENNEQIFASKYKTVLPSVEVLKELLESK
ncbi:PDDEXK nuclease domain-containing protein [Flavobacterium lipolyticum]|uniref:PDDEXK nuclease domain-containing protein n=1 Tax=Flavobacterium lipolyticum TaxID=2893754 RepID=A0ABS8M3R5_9FLAO|nr:PDDEXK nuclease domain-containing protein [Flavobacterium sp. F-126]MCC9019324.1 PDDEXK nuclease domain-containing protein [Flavobacterium sp. F-126]